MDDQEEIVVIPGEKEEEESPETMSDESVAEAESEIPTSEEESAE